MNNYTKYNTLICYPFEILIWLLHQKYSIGCNPYYSFGVIHDLSNFILEFIDLIGELENMKFFKFFLWLIMFHLENEVGRGPIQATLIVPYAYKYIYIYISSLSDLFLF